MPTKETPYLILHKVRGQPAFDIAEIDYLGDWIVSSSGHRAYPFQYWPLEDLADVSDINNQGFHSRPVNHGVNFPLELPDHYSVNDKPKPTPKLVRSNKMTIAAEFNLNEAEIAEVLAAIQGLSDGGQK